MLLKILLYDFTELSDQFKQTDFKKAVKESFIAFKESNNEVFGKEVIESFLFDSTLCHLFWHEFMFNQMSDFVGLAVELELNIEFIFEHIVRRIHVEG